MTLIEVEVTQSNNWGMRATRLKSGKERCSEESQLSSQKVH